MPNEESPQTPQTDLVSLLTHDQRTEVTLLLTASTEIMRAWLVKAFDKVPPKPKDSDPKDMNDIPALPTQYNSTPTGTVGSSPESPNVNIKLKDLKKATLESFDTWQHKVLIRIGEVFNSKEAHENGGSASYMQSTIAEPESVSKTVDDDEDNNVFPPIPTPLKEGLSAAAKPLVIHSLLLLFLSLEHYDARSRTLLRIITSSLGVKNTVLVEQEKVVALGLVKAAKHGISAEDEKQKAADHSKWGNRLKIGLAGVGGAVLIGVTGGLAAPLVAAGIGGVMGGIGLGATAAAGYLGALAGSGALVGALFGAYGGRMTGKMMERYSKEIEDFAFIPIKPHNEENRLSVTIGISGWLSSPEDVFQPWHSLSAESEVYALQWEKEALLELGGSLQTMISTYAWAYVKKEIIKRTILAALWTALWPISLLRIAKVVDNPFSIAKTRADKAGLVLADALINKAQGERPVTLIAYSLGSRLVYSCLLSLADRGAMGLVENVYIMGSPTPTSAEEWAAMRSVVSGRLVNVFSENDYILAFLYRTSAVQLGVAGLQEVESPESIENFNVTKEVDGHLRYRFLVGEILGKIAGKEVVDWEIVGEEVRLADIQRREEEKLQKEGEEKGNDKELEEAVEKAEKEHEKKHEERKEGTHMFEKLHIHAA